MSRRPHPTASSGSPLASAVDPLLDHLSEGRVEALRAAAEVLSADDLAQLVERLDPRQRGGEAVRQRIVTRAGRADLTPPDRESGELDGTHTEPAARQRPPGSVPVSHVSFPESAQTPEVQR